MGILNFFSKAKAGPSLERLPKGCVTVDRNGTIVTSTLSQSFPETKVNRIIQDVMAIFRSAQDAQLVFNELQLTYPALRITAKELKGGAMIFISPP
jgi:hypothetical protein